MVQLAPIILPPLQLNPQDLWLFCDVEALIGSGCVFDSMFRAAIAGHVGCPDHSIKDTSTATDSVSKHSSKETIFTVLSVTVLSVLTFFTMGNPMIQKDFMPTGSVSHCRHRICEQSEDQAVGCSNQ